VALGKFINSQPDCDKLKILFLRISEGVYCFGKRILNMKIVNELILIRIGGGYTELKEFMDKFSQAELDRIELHDCIESYLNMIKMQNLASNGQKFKKQ